MAYGVEEAEEIQTVFLEQIQTGRSLRSVCKDEGMPNQATIMRWIMAQPEFANKYTRARMNQADVLFDRMEEVEENVANGSMDSHAARVVLDSMRWRASKLAPKVYGDRLEVQVSDTRISISGALAAAQLRLVDVIDITPSLPAPDNVANNVDNAEQD